METYTYLLLGIAIVIPVIIFLILRRDLISIVIKPGLIGGAAGLIAELFYFRDYWRPPSLVGVAKISPEDFVFGFAITAIGLIAYPVLTRTAFCKSAFPSRMKVFGCFVIFALTSLIIFNIVLKINSIFVSSANFLILAVIIILMRRDLLKPALVSAALVTVFILVIYIGLFDFLSPEFWDKYWLLANTRSGLTILGNVPITEIIWYFTWTLLASTLYPFVTGKVMTKYD